MQFGTLVKVIGEVRNKGRIGVVVEVRDSTDAGKMVDVKFDPGKPSEKTITYVADDLEKVMYEDNKDVIAADRRQATQDAPGGMKYDQGKPQPTLLFAGLPGAVAGVIDVLTFGAQKYSAHSWRTVPEGYTRYRDALYRHLSAIERGEVLDPESGLPHWSHVATNALFLYELQGESV